MKGRGRRASYRSLTARAAVLKRRDGDEPLRAAVGSIEGRVYAREFPPGLSSQKRERQGREAPCTALRKLAVERRDRWARRRGPPSALACVTALRRRRPGGARRGAARASPSTARRRRCGAAPRRLLSEALAALACPLMDASEAFVAGVEAYDPTDARRRPPRLRGGAGRRRGGRASAGRACGDDALVAEELAVLSAPGPRGPAAARCLLHAAAGADAAADGVFRGGCGRQLVEWWGLWVVCIRLFFC